MEALPQGGKDESKFANLSEREAAAHGDFQWMAGQQEGTRAQNALTQDDGERDGADGQPIFHQHMRIDQHADGYEKDGTE